MLRLQIIDDTGSFARFSDYSIIIVGLGLKQISWIFMMVGIMTLGNCTALDS